MLIFPLWKSTSTKVPTRGVAYVTVREGASVWGVQTGWVIRLRLWTKNVIRMQNWKDVLSVAYLGSESNGDHDIVTQSRHASVPPFDKIPPGTALSEAAMGLLTLSWNSSRWVRSIILPKSLIGLGRFGYYLPLYRSQTSILSLRRLCSLEKHLAICFRSWPPSMRSSSSESRRNSRSSFTVLDVMDHLFLLSICVRMVSLSRRSSCQTHTTRQTLRNEDREKRYLVCRRTAKSYMDKGTKWGGQVWSWKDTPTEWL